MQKLWRMLSVVHHLPKPMESIISDIIMMTNIASIFGLETPFRNREKEKYKYEARFNRLV